MCISEVREWEKKKKLRELKEDKNKRLPLCLTEKTQTQSNKVRLTLSEAPVLSAPALMIEMLLHLSLCLIKASHRELVLVLCLMQPLLCIKIHTHLLCY